MNEPELISIEKIDPNPYQVRSTENPDVVSELAASIVRNGLMQIPTARAVDGRYQLAFGHTRLAAYKLLVSEGMIDYEKMPLNVRPLDDLQLFELAVDENIKRRDLNPIELARAMRTYLDTFHKTSEEAAEKFNVSPETVRGSVRLLGLPEDVQKQVAAGELTVGAARGLLSLQKIAPEAMPEAIDELTESVGKFNVFDSPEEAISSVLAQQKDVVQLNRAPFLDVAPKKFPFKHLEKITAQKAYKILDLDKKTVPVKELEECLQLVELGAGEENPVLHNLSRDELEKLTVLVHPPTCKQCPFHTSVDNDDYCGFKICAERKEAAWAIHQLEETSKRLKIPLYDPASDGANKVRLDGYEEKHRKLFAARGPDLRLIPHAGGAGGYGDFRFEGLGNTASLVVVGETAVKLQQAKEKQADSGAAKIQRQDQQRAMQQANEVKIARFAWQVAVPVFIKAVEGIKSFEFIKDLDGNYGWNRLANMLEDVPNLLSPRTWDKLAQEKPAKRLKMAQCFLIFDLLNSITDTNGPAEKKNAITVYAKQLQNVAGKWGVKLPRNWLTIAKEWDEQKDETANEDEI